MTYVPRGTAIAFAAVSVTVLGLLLPDIELLILTAYRRRQWW
ncbi:hypothetical protein [Actinopolymorpha pittospori]